MSSNKGSSVYPIVRNLLLTLIAIAALAMAAAAFGTDSLTSTDYTEVFCGAPPSDAMDPAAQIPVFRPITAGMFANVPVNIVKFSYDPQNLTVYIGDTVTWTNIDGAGHTTTSDNNLWNSGTLQNGQTFSYTFNTPGTFPYHCSIHSQIRGSITVLASTPTATPTSAATPTLGNYSATSVALGGNATVVPDAAPTLAVRMIVSTITDFKGRLEADPSTGVIRITDAHPAGIYAVRVIAADSGGGTSSIVFGLTVTTPAECTTVTFSPAANFSAAAGARSVAVGDFNRDGKQYLAVANDGANNVSILIGDGSGGFAARANLTVGTTPYGIAVADLNGDGKQDIVVANEISNNVSVLLGNGAGVVSAANNFAAGTNPTAAAAGVFNGDP